MKLSEDFPIRTVSFWSTDPIAAGIDYAMTARLLLSRETTLQAMGLKDLDISKDPQVLPAVEGFKARHITLKRYSALRRDAKLHQNCASRDTKP